MSNRKNIKQFFSVAILAAMFGSSVYAQTGSTTDATTTGSGAASATTRGASASASGGTSQASGTLSKSDQKMLQQMANANLAEIEAGKLAQEKSQNDQVKTFAQQMIDDHTKALQEVQTLAQAKGVTLPTEPDSKHKKMADKMNKLSGTAFDKRYMAQGGLGDHKDTHRLLQKVQKSASDADVKALAAKTLPVVDQHLSMAKDLQGKKLATSTRGTSASTGASGSTGSSASGMGGAAGTTGTTGTGSTTDTKVNTTGNKAGSKGSATSGSSGSSGSSTGATGATGASGSTGTTGTGATTDTKVNTTGTGSTSGGSSGTGGSSGGSTGGSSSATGTSGSTGAAGSTGTTGTGATTDAKENTSGVTSPSVPPASR